MDHTPALRPLVLHPRLDVPVQLVGRTVKLRRHHRIEDQIGVGVAGHHAEIVNGHIGGNLPDQVLQLSALFVDSIIVGINGVHMDHRLTAQLVCQLQLRPVNGVVKGEHILVGRHLGVE